MINQYKNAEKIIGLTQEDADAVLSHILSEYRRLDGREEHGVDWVDLISEVMDEKNIARNNKHTTTHMKTTNHTPGPWYVTDTAVIGNDGGTWIAEHPAVKWQTLKSVTKAGDAIVEESIKQANANAHLIASAPDLLSALRFLLADYVAINGEKLTKSSVPVKMAQAAIAKAEGVA
jgi:hypothetical protein